MNPTIVDDKPQPRWATRKQPDGWAINTPTGDQYATAHTQVAANNFAAQMAGIDHLLKRVHTAQIFARHRKRVEELKEAFDILTNAKTVTSSKMVTV